MIIISEIATNKVYHIYPDGENVQLTNNGLITPFERVPNVKPSKFKLTENVPSPDTWVGGGVLKYYASAWHIDNQELYDQALAANKKATVPKVVSMAGARRALLRNNLLTTVDTAVTNGIDEEVKILWEYATELHREDATLLAITDALGLTELQVDDLFITAKSL